MNKANDNQHRISIRITIDIHYDLSEVYHEEPMDQDDRLRETEHLTNHLKRALTHSIGNGLLTGDSAVLVDDYALKVQPIAVSHHTSQLTDDLKKPFTYLIA